MEFQNNKISELIEGQLPNFLQEEGPKFVQFVENYYEWMETSKLEVSVSDGGVIVFDNTVGQNGQKPKHKIKATKQINGSDEVKHVYAEVINSYLMDNGNYVFYIKEYSEDPNSPQTRGFSKGETVTIIEGDGGSSGTINVVSYIQNASFSSKNLWNLQDIDRTLDEYVDFFMKEYLKGFPLSFPTASESTDIDVDDFKKFLVKHSREFYQSKGTKNSFKYFFRSIFNEEVEVSYPKEKILKASNNIYQSTSTILIKPNSTTIPDIVSKKIIGQTSQSESYVESVISENMGSYSVLKVELNQQTISGSFSLNENILDDTGQVIGTAYFCATSVELIENDEIFTPNQRFFINRDREVVEYVDILNSNKGTFIELMVCDVNDGNITGVNVLNGGTGHVVGEKLTFNNTDCFLNEVFQKSVIASVSSVDSDGAITGVKVDRVGEGYIKLPNITKIGEDDVSGESFEFVSSNVGTLKDIAIRNQGVGYFGSDFEVDLNSTGQNNVKIKLGTIFNDGGKYTNQNSFLSNIKVIQDSRYYQSFSYVIESSLQLFKFKDLLKSLIHPAGTEMFSTISSVNKEDVKMVSSSAVLKIPFLIKKIIKTYSDIPLDEFGSNMVQSTLYDGGLAEDLPTTVDAGDSGADSANFFINSFGSWESVHQIYKHKYTNLKVGFNDKNCFKFEEVVGLKASIDSGQRDVSLARTAFFNVVKEDNRDFTSEDFVVGDVVFQGDDYENATLVATVEKWEPSESRLELLKTSGQFNINEIFKVNSYTKKYLYSDTNVLDGTYDQINQKMRIVGDIDLQTGDVLYQGESNNKTASATFVRLHSDGDVIVTTTQGNFSLGDIKIDSNSSTLTYDLVDIVDYVVLGTKNVSISNKILKFTNSEILFEIDDIVYQEDGSGNKITEGQIKTIFDDGIEVCCCVFVFAICFVVCL